MKIRRIDFSPGDWIGGTLGMTLEEEGLYIRLVARTYSLGASLDDNPTTLAKLCQVRPQIMRRLLSRLKLMGKFHETGGKLVSNRCETEMKLAENRLEQARFNGSKGGRPKDLAEPDGYQSVKPTSTTTTTIEKEPVAGSLGKQERAHVGSNGRGTRLSEAWRPNAEDVAFASRLGLDAGTIADEFADYWHAIPGGKGIKLDWDATWRNWCRRAQPRASNGDARSRGGRSGSGSIAAALARVHLPGGRENVD